MRNLFVSCIVLGAATGLLVAAGRIDGGPERYVRADAVVQQLPASRTFRRGGEWQEGFVAVAALRDGSDRVEVAVGRTARPGDHTRVWVDTTSGRIWATVSPDDSPLGLAAADVMTIGVFAGALGGVVLCILALWALDRFSRGDSGFAHRLNRSLGQYG